MNNFIHNLLDGLLVPDSDHGPEQMLYRRRYNFYESEDSNGGIRHLIPFDRQPAVLSWEKIEVDEAVYRLMTRIGLVIDYDNFFTSYEAPPKLLKVEVGSDFLRSDTEESCWQQYLDGDEPETLEITLPRSSPLKRVCSMFKRDEELSFPHLRHRDLQWRYIVKSSFDCYKNSLGIRSLFSLPNFRPFVLVQRRHVVDEGTYRVLVSTGHLQELAPEQVLLKHDFRYGLMEFVEITEDFTLEEESFLN